MIKVLELFAGIGACSKALTRLGIEHEIVDAVEIDKYAIKSFNAVHGTNFEPQDIREWDKDIKCDLIMHGSPCQDFSIAGLGAGGDEGSGTRSSLMYETLRIVEKIRPKVVIWENVKNVLSKKHVHNVDNYIMEMRKLGYTSAWQVMNAKDYGVPQNRERFFIVSTFHYCITAGVFPPPFKLERCLKDYLEDNVSEKYYISEKQLNGMIKTNYNSYKLTTLLKDRNGIVDTIKARYEGCPQLVIETNNSKGYDIIVDGDAIDISYPSSSTRRGRVGHGVAKTITSNGNQCVYHDSVIRKFTPKECWRLMGFDDEDFERAAEVCSNTQLYKQAGNSIVVDVIQSILDSLYREIGIS